MMLVNKRVEVRLVATDPQAHTSWEVNPRDYLTPLQAMRFVRWPDMILQISHHIADDLRQKGQQRIEVRAKVIAALQDRERQWMIDPNVDLAAQPRTLRPAPWIVPLGKAVTDRSEKGKPALWWGSTF